MGKLMKRRWAVGRGSRGSTWGLRAENLELRALLLSQVLRGRGWRCGMPQKHGHT
jgi:hypothetical protein